jgi:RNA polymerase sigma-70 factor, ECF subfamily
MNQVDLHMSVQRRQAAIRLSRSREAVMSFPDMQQPSWFERDSYLAALKLVMDPASPAYVGRWRCVPTRANRQPAVAHYVCRPGDTEYRAQVLEVLEVVQGKIAEITAFGPGLFPAFGLPLMSSHADSG